MKYNSSFGIWEFKGEEESLIFVYMWTVLMDTSFKGWLELIYRIIFKRPPKEYYELKKSL